jgi:hypothetical protein
MAARLDHLGGLPRASSFAGFSVGGRWRYQSLAFGAELIRDAQADGMLRPGFSADDLARIFAVNAYLVRDRPAGDDGWRRTLQFTLDGLRAQPDSTSE